MQKVKMAQTIDEKQIALRRFVSTRLSNKDYMENHSLEDLKETAKQRRNTVGFERIWDEVVNKIKKGHKKSSPNKHPKMRKN
ncbi:MAG: hypothetical protein WA667_01490 [Candidatus Nitrosopolaris sp.]